MEKQAVGNLDPPQRRAKDVVKSFLTQFETQLSALERGLTGIAAHKAWSTLCEAIEQFGRDLARSQSYYDVDEDLMESVRVALLTLLELDEERVRMKTAEALRDIVKDLFLRQYFHDETEGFGLTMMYGIASNANRGLTLRPTTLGDSSMIAMDDTTGWHFLESYTLAMHSTLLGLADSGSSKGRETFWELLDAEVELEGERVKTVDAVLVTAGRHRSRHVRERAQCFIANFFALSTACVNDVVKVAMTRPCGEGQTAKTLLDLALEVVAEGLEDDWSQIRYVATDALDKVLSACMCVTEKNDLTEDTLTLGTHWATLVPRLCLNRFHAAKSVQTLSLDVWIRHFGPGALGRTLLGRYNAQTLAYYVSMTHARNHMVAEAACHSLSEYCAKLSPSLSAPYYADALDALDACLRDERWPVKDAACLASGTLWRVMDLPLSQSVPTLSLPLPAALSVPRSESLSLSLVQRVAVFLSLYRECLRDCIWSVRENAAIAVGETLKSKDCDVATIARTSALQYVTDKLMDALPRGEGERETATAFSFLPREMVAAAEDRKREREKEAMALMPSINPMGVVSSVSGSMPNTVNRRGWGCCIDCVDLREALPWEVSQGALYLLREIALSHRDNALSLCACSVRTPEGESVSPFTAVGLLLQSTAYASFDKLHAVTYQEMPAVLEKMFEWSKAGDCNERDGETLKKEVLGLRDAMLATAER